MKKPKLNALAVGAAFAAVALSPAASAADNPFSAAELKGGYLLAQADKKTDAKCGGDKKAEHACGGAMKADTASATQADKKAEHKCGGDKKADHKCGAMKAKKADATSGTKVPKAPETKPAESAKK